MIQKVLVGVALVAAFVALGFAFRPVSVPLGASSGPDHYNQENFYGGVLRSGVGCATATFNPGNLTTSTIGNATTTDIAVTGAVLGDKCIGSLTSATTSAIAVSCQVTGTATTTLEVENLGTTNAAIDLATGTAKVCIIH